MHKTRLDVHYSINKKQDSTISKAHDFLVVFSARMFCNYCLLGTCRYDIAMDTPVITLPLSDRVAPQCGAR